MPTKPVSIPTDGEPNPFQARVRNRLRELQRDSFAAAELGQFQDRRFVYDIITLRKASVRGSNLTKLAKALDWNIGDILGGEGEQPPPASASEAIFDEPGIPMPPSGHEESPPQMTGNRDVPEYGVAVGGEGDEADFSFNGQVIDYVSRPPGIARRKDVFMLRVVNSSMYPVFNPGDPLFLDKRVAHPGADVVVELKPGPEGQPGAGYIKRLVRRLGSRIVVEQFNPPKQIEFDLATVKDVYRVIPLAELMGVP